MVSAPPTDPTRIFVDASVLFSASHSPRGFARDLIEAGIEGDVILVLSPFVIEETRRNLSRKAPQALPLFEVFLAPSVIHMVNPSTALVERVASVIVLKDAPVVAGALHAGATLIATYDHKDLLSKRQEILAAFGVTVATPKRSSLASKTRHPIPDLANWPNMIGLPGCVSVRALTTRNDGRYKSAWFGTR